MVYQRMPNLRIPGSLEPTRQSGSRCAAPGAHPAGGRLPVASFVPGRCSVCWCPALPHELWARPDGRPGHVCAGCHKEEFCSSCGAPLGSMTWAGSQGDLCEACYLRTPGTGERPASPLRSLAPLTDAL